MIIDLNCDLGEGVGLDAELIPWITSANVCCGAHAGSEAEIRRTLALAARHGITVGAHPGFADREHFGRRETHLDDAPLFDLIREQIETLTRWASAEGTIVRYAKPHGALYHQACRDDRVARIFVNAAAMPILALPDSRLEVACRDRFDFFVEGFADRRYRADGSLVPRSEPDAMITSVADAVAQARTLLQRGTRSLCVHGDNPDAVSFVRELRRAFETHGVIIQSFLEASPVSLEPRNSRPGEK